MSKALVVIDIQNDYFETGKFPLWNSTQVLNKIETTIQTALSRGTPVIFIQHIAGGPSPFFTDGSVGAQIHPRIKAVGEKCPVIIKEHADSFHQTNLGAVLTDLKVTDLLICGMMTQNCVTHTALSKAAEKYRVTILEDCCTTVSEILHKIAIKALSNRAQILKSEEAFHKTSVQPENSLI